MMIIRYSNKFKKDYKNIIKRGLNVNDLKKVVELLANNKKLPEKYKDYDLNGDYKRISRMSYSSRLVVNIFNR